MKWLFEHEREVALLDRMQRLAKPLPLFFNQFLEAGGLRIEVGRNEEVVRRQYACLWSGRDLGRSKHSRHLAMHGECNAPPGAFHLCDERGKALASWTSTIFTSPRLVWFDLETRRKDLCGESGWSLLRPDPLDVRAEGLELLIDVLVAAIDVVEAVDLGGALGGEGGEDEGR